ncbi:MAG: amino acid permease [Chloroflexi bacterium]|nr:MAG: amino acid permease [Chloroflexota bacterium]
MTDDGKEGPPSLEERVTRPGKRLGDRMVRIVRPAGGEFQRRGGHYVATPEALIARDRFGRWYQAARRVLFGARLASEQETQERLSVKTGLAIMASDNISSSAYATEEAMRVLAFAGLAALTLTMPIAIAVCVYVLTVAVSSAAGVAAISSFVPALHENRVFFALALIALITLGNLRGIREAGVLFAAPTYIYVLSLYTLIGIGLTQLLAGVVVPATAPPHPFDPAGTQLLTALLVLRAFASGSVGLTGSEAVANGVPSFRPPETKNAVTTLVLMGTMFGTLFLGITFLATTIGIHPDHDEIETVNSLLTRSIVGADNPLYFVVQISTAIILALAANTGFTGFPRLASVLADDRFMPRQFAFRGERLAFSFGILALAIVAGLVLVAFEGSVSKLVPLYTIGVFVAFTLSQSGLVRRWLRLRNKGWRISVFINGFGTVVTGTVLVVVAYTKL